jgi:hypothetical protein
VIEEEYTCNSNGNLKVRICEKTTEYAKEHRLGYWSRTASALPVSDSHQQV